MNNTHKVNTKIKYLYNKIKVIVFISSWWSVLVAIMIILSDGFINLFLFIKYHSCLFSPFFLNLVIGFVFPFLLISNDIPKLSKFFIDKKSKTFILILLLGSFGIILSWTIIDKLSIHIFNEFQFQLFYRFVKRFNNFNIIEMSDQKFYHVVCHKHLHERIQCFQVQKRKWFTMQKTKYHHILFITQWLLL